MAKKQQAPPKEEAPKVKKTAKSLILKKSIHIPNVARGNDSKDHFMQGSTYLPGTTVTKEMIEAYENARKRVQGDTPIEAFCE